MQSRAFCTVHNWSRCNQPGARVASPLVRDTSSFSRIGNPAIVVKRFVEVPFEHASLGQPVTRWFRRFYRAEEYFRQRCLSNRWATMYRVRGRYEVVTRR